MLITAHLFFRTLYFRIPNRLKENPIMEPDVDCDPTKLLEAVHSGKVESVV